MPFDKAGQGDHAEFVKDAVERFEFYRDQREGVLRDSLEHWDLYLTKQREFRTKGEEWRANIALPDAFANVEAKVANLVSIFLGSDPVIQPEGVTDKDMDTSKDIERLLDYAYRKNAFSKWLIKMLRPRSVAGTAFFKLTWVEQTHTITLSRTAGALQKYAKTLEKIAQQPGLPAPPDWLTEPEPFEQWRKLVNDAARAKVPAPPLDGPQRIVTYRGPKLHVLPLSSVYLDPLVDEMSNQNFVVHRVVKTKAWLAEKTKAGLYDAEAVAFAMEGWDGRVAEDEEVDLAVKMGINTDASAAADPQYANAVELLEVWQPGTEYPYALILNRRAVINKAPAELPFLHGQIGIGATRATVIPGHFYGISDLRPPRDLFWEKRKLRNLRVDAVTLNVLPAYIRLREVGLPEMMYKIKPGALIPASRPDAISPLIRDPLPPEAYREPAEMDAGIEDSMGVFASTKGQQATIGRVTGTEFQGRENRAQIRFKLDSIFLEEDLYPINTQMLAMYAQLADDPVRIAVSGGSDPFLEINRRDLMEAMETQWRFRGPNKAIQKDMQVQQLLMWVKTFGETLLPQEMRYAARLVLDILDIRGASKLVSDDGTAAKTAKYQQAQQAAAAQQAGGQAEAEKAAVKVPTEVSGDQAKAMG
jgi:hypothetical protein